MLIHASLFQQWACTWIISAVLSVALVSAQSGCFGGFRYQLFSDKLNQKDAVKGCSNQGGRLVPVQSEAVAQFLNSTFREKFWIGLKKKKNAEEYEWVDSTPAMYTNWAAGPPDTDDEHCVVSEIPSGLWLVTGCSKNEKESYVCQFDLPVNWVTCAGFQYSYFTTPANWSDAELHCQREGGHLAKAETVQESVCTLGALGTQCNPGQGWVGLGSLFSPNDYRWSLDLSSTGNTFTVTALHVLEFCMVISQPLGIHLEKCRHTNSYICQRPTSGSVQLVLQCDSLQVNYSTLAFSWTEANQQCSNSGGHLLSRDNTAAVRCAHQLLLSASGSGDGATLPIWAQCSGMPCTPGQCHTLVYNSTTLGSTPVQATSPCWAARPFICVTESSTLSTAAVEASTSPPTALITSASTIPSRTSNAPLQTAAESSSPSTAPLESYTSPPTGTPIQTVADSSSPTPAPETSNTPASEISATLQPSTTSTDQDIPLAGARKASSSNTAVIAGGAVGGVVLIVILALVLLLLRRRRNSGNFDPSLKEARNAGHANPIYEDGSIPTTLNGHHTNDPIKGQGGSGELQDGYYSRAYENTMDFRARNSKLSTSSKVPSEYLEPSEASARGSAEYSDTWDGCSSSLAKLQAGDLQDSQQYDDVIVP